MWVPDGEEMEQQGSAATADLRRVTASLGVIKTIADSYEAPNVVAVM